MSIRKISQDFYKELSSGSSKYLLGNVGDKIRVETVISVEQFAISTSDSPFILNNKEGMVGAGWVQDPRGQFANFKIGDTVICFNQLDSVNSSHTIVDKLDEYNIQLDSALPYVDSLPANNYVISLANPITAVKYHYGFIENSAADNFISPVDGVSDQCFSIESKAASDVTASKMLPLGPLTWQDGLAGSLTKNFSGASVDVCSINGVSIDPGTTDGVYKSKFKITHWTKITPYILYAQLTNQLNGVAPDDFITVNKCWKFISQFEAAKLYTDPNFIVSTVFDDTIGNTGWDNENFNTGKTNYSKNSVIYKDAGGNTIDSLQLTSAETTITFNIANTVDSPFTTAIVPDTATQIVVELLKVPADPSEYQNGELADQNFVFDRARQTVGCAAVNGDNYGGTFQALKSISAALTDSAHVAVTMKIAFGVDAIAKFEESSIPRYILRVSTQKFGLTTADGTNDLVTLEIDLQEMFIDTSDATMIVFDRTTMLRHPEANPDTEGIVAGSVATPEIDPTNLQWGFVVSVSPSGILVKDVTNGNTIGVADFTTDFATTMALLVTSINSNTAEGSLFGGAPAFSNAAGYTAAYNVFGDNKLHISAPAGFGTLYNGVQLNVDVNGGTVSRTPAAVQAYSGGQDAEYETLDVMPEDEIVMCTDFYIDETGRSANVIKLTQVQGQIIAKNGSKEFSLDKFILPLTSVQLTGETQQFDIQQARSFNVPASSIRKFIEVKRRNDLDTGSKRYFSSNYALMIRWETWVENLNVDPAFFNPSLPNNGFNQWWFQYAQLSGWTLNYKINVNATKDGEPQAYEYEWPIVPHDYASNAEYTAKSVCAFREEDLAAIMSGTGGAVQLQRGGTIIEPVNGQNYLTDGLQINFTTKKTLLVAIFTKASLPASPGIEMKVEVFKKGGTPGIRVYSSYWVSDGNSWFTSVDGTDKVQLHSYGDSVIGLAYLDPSKSGFPTEETYLSFSARLYEVGGVLETDDSVPIQTDDGINIIVD